MSLGKPFGKLDPSELRRLEAALLYEVDIMAPALDQGVGYGIVLGLGAAFALGECGDASAEHG